MNFYSPAILYLVTRMIDDNLASLHTIKNLCNQAVALPDFYFTTFGASFIHNKHSPSIMVAKQTAGRDLQDIVLMPEYETRLNTVTIAQSLPIFIV